jgi:hypothetical protein
VLVGATAGAFQVRVYNGLYPSEVAGAVLIHADDPDIFAHEPEFMKGSLAGCVLDASMAEVRYAGDFGNRPLFVLAERPDAVIEPVRNVVTEIRAEAQTK